MPLFNDPYYSSSSAHYYVPTTFSVSGRTPFSFSYMSPLSTMLSAGIGSNPVPRGFLSSRTFSPLLPSISETSSPILTRRDYSGNHRSSPRTIGKTYYRAPRPITINTEAIDLSSNKHAATPTDENDDSVAPGRIHRGRTVVRMHTKKLKENPGLKKKKTPGELLMEKFLIKEKPDPKEEEPMPRRRRVWEIDDESESPENNICRSGTIKRYTSGLRKKSVPLVDNVDTVSSNESGLPRRISVTDELLKEEAAILDCMIQEEMGMPPPPGDITAKRKKTGEMLDVEGISKRKTKNYTTKKSSKTLPIDGVENKTSKRAYSKKKSSKTLPLDSVDSDNTLKNKIYNRKKSSKTLPLDSINQIFDSDNNDEVIKNKRMCSDTSVLTTRQRAYSRKKSPKPLPLDSLDNNSDNMFGEICDSHLSGNKRKSSENEIRNEDNKNINIQSSVGEVENKVYNKANKSSPKFVIDSIHVEETLSPKFPKKLINYEVIIEETTDSDVDKRKRSSENDTEGMKKIKKLSYKKEGTGNEKTNLSSSTEDSFSSLEEPSHNKGLNSESKTLGAENLYKCNFPTDKKKVSEKESDSDLKTENVILKDKSNAITKNSLENIEETERITECVLDSNDVENKDLTKTCLMEKKEEIDKNKLFAKKILEKQIDKNKIDVKLKKTNTKMQLDNDNLVKLQGKDGNLSAGKFKNVHTSPKLKRDEIDMTTQLHTSTINTMSADLLENEKQNILIEIKDIPSDESEPESKKQLITDSNKTKFSIPKKEPNHKNESFSETVVKIQSSKQNVGKDVLEEIHDKLEISTKLGGKSSEIDNTTVEQFTEIIHKNIKEIDNVTIPKHNEMELLMAEYNKPVEKSKKQLTRKFTKQFSVDDFNVKKNNVQPELFDSKHVEEVIPFTSGKDDIAQTNNSNSNKSDIRNEKLSLTKENLKEDSLDEILEKKHKLKSINKKKTDFAETAKYGSHSLEQAKKDVGNPSQNVNDFVKAFSTEDTIINNERMETLSLFEKTESKDEYSAIKKRSNNSVETTKEESKPLELLKKDAGKPHKKVNNLVKAFSSEGSFNESERCKTLLLSEKKEEYKNELPTNLTATTKQEIKPLEQPKKDVEKPVQKVNDLIKAFSSDGSNAISKQSNVSELNKKIKEISSQNKIFETKKSYSLDENKICDKSSGVASQAQDNKVFSNVGNGTEITNIPSKNKTYSPNKSKAVTKLESLDNSMSNIFKNDKDFKLDNLSKNRLESHSDEKFECLRTVAVEPCTSEKAESVNKIESKKSSLTKLNKCNNENVKDISYPLVSSTDRNKTVLDMLTDQNETVLPNTNKKDIKKIKDTNEAVVEKIKDKNKTSVAKPKIANENVVKPSENNKIVVDKLTESNKIPLEKTTNTNKTDVKKLKDENKITLEKSADANKEKTTETDKSVVENSLVKNKTVVEMLTNASKAIVKKPPDANKSTTGTLVEKPQDVNKSTTGTLVEKSQDVNKSTVGKFVCANKITVEKPTAANKIVAERAPDTNKTIIKKTTDDNKTVTEKPTNANKTIVGKPADKNKTVIKNPTDGDKTVIEKKESEVTSNKKLNQSVDMSVSVSSCSESSSGSEETNSEEETSSEEESEDDSSDEEPSGKVSFSDESSDEVGTSPRANGSRSDSGFNSPSSSLLETHAFSSEGTVNNSSPS